MSLHINRFIDRIKANESRGQKDFVMSMSDAKDLHADITKLLLTLQVLLDERQNSSANSTTDDVKIVEIQGGSF